MNEGKFRPDRLRKARLERGLTMRAAGDATGLTKQTIFSLEHGRQQPHMSTLQKLSEGLDVTIAYLLGLEDEDLIFLYSEEEGETSREGVPSLPQPGDIVMGPKRLLDLLAREIRRKDLDARLTAWKSAKEEGVSKEEYSWIIRSIHHLLNEAFESQWDPRLDANSDLANSGGVAQSSDYWKEVRAAARYYGELIEAVRSAGLVVDEYGQAPEVREPDAT